MRNHGHANVVKFFRQTMSDEDVRRTNAHFDVNYIGEWYPSDLALFARCGRSDAIFGLGNRARWATRIHRERFDAPYQVLLVTGDVYKASVWLAAPPVLDEHLTPLHHLNVMVFGERFGRVQVEEWSDSTKNSLDILRISLKLLSANALVNLFEAAPGVSRSARQALLHELIECQPVLRVDVRIVVQSVEENETVC